MIGRALSPSAFETGQDGAARPATRKVSGSCYERLLKRADFVAAQRGRRFASPLMTVQGLMRESGEQGPARMGITVTRKVGTATERNRIKRRLRAALKLCADRVYPSVDYVVVARRDLLAAPFTSIVTDLENAISRLGPKPTAKQTLSPDRPR